MGPTYCILLFFTAVFGTDPDMTREGGSIPVTLTLQEATEKNVVLLPLGACDDGAHSQNDMTTCFISLKTISKISLHASLYSKC